MFASFTVAQPEMRVEGTDGGKGVTVTPPTPSSCSPDEVVKKKDLLTVSESSSKSSSTMPSAETEIGNNGVAGERSKEVSRSLGKTSG